MKRIAILLFLSLAGAACAESPIRTQGDNLTLTLALPESKPAMTFRFIVANTGQTPEIVYGPFANYTRLIVVRPNGEKKEVFNWKEMGKSPTPLQPAAKAEWDVDVRAWIEFKEPGDYRISFSVNGRESNQIVVIKDKTPNQASDATSEPAPGAASSAHQR
ncbi:MAG: hypothetical protein WCP86_10440 [bacterium]